MKQKEKKRKGRIVSVDEYFDNLSDAQSESLVAAAMEIATERDKTEREIRDLLFQRKDQEALKLMRRYLGIQ
jgi:hypothetical protein